MLPDDLLDAAGKVDWAEAQIPCLKERIRATIAGRVYERVEDPDPNTGWIDVFVAGDFTVPSIINAEVGAILHSLRSSLDLLLMALIVRKEGKIPSKNIHFPIRAGDTKLSALDGFNEAMKPIEKRLTANDLQILKSCQPYDGGNDGWIHGLNVLNRTDKHHRRLVFFPIVGRTMIFQGKVHPDGSASTLTDMPRFNVYSWRGRDHMAPLYSLPPGCTGLPDDYFKLTIEVAFDEVPGFPSETIETALLAVSQKAKAFIARFA